MLTILVILSLYDLNADHRIDGGDLSMLLASWGPGEGKRADFDGDGRVDGADLAALLSVYGTARDIDIHHTGGGCNWQKTLPRDQVGEFEASPWPSHRRRRVTFEHHGQTVTAWIDEVAP